MSDETSSSPDLAAIDLARSFLPAWAQDAAPSRLDPRFANRDDREERPRRGEVRRDARGDRRPPRREGGRPTGRGPRREERAPERGPKPVEPIAGWEATFLPDKHGVDGLAKQIKTTAKAYPLFDLARLVLDKSPRYNVEFKRVSDTATPLFQLKADGTLWLTERDAVQRALAAHLDRFYRRERVAVDPPKGDFPCVAVCGMSGTLLGPPNYHDYQSKLVRLHAERFANMPFEAFKARIRMERGEEIVAKWREEQSAKDVFFPLDLSRPAEPEPVKPAESEPTAEAAPVVEAEPSAEAAPEEPTAVVESEAPAEEPAAAPIEEPAGEPQPETAPAEPAPRLESLAEVEQHFREHHLARAVTRIRERIVAPGSAALNHSAPEVLRLTRAMWDQLSRFPLPLAHRLAQHLSSRGVQIFKAHDNVTYAGVARPHFLDAETTPVSEALRAMLKAIEEHVKAPRAEQWKALLALRPVPEEGGEQARDASVAADLLWLLHQGHVIDYAHRGLELAHRPKAPPPRKPAKAAAPQATSAPEPTAEPAPADEAPRAAEAPAEAIAESEPAVEEIAEIPAEPESPPAPAPDEATS